MGIFVERRGDKGTPVVCVHGSLSAGMAAFSEQVPLSENWRIVIPYRRGYGTNDLIDRVDLNQDAGDIVELLGDGAHVVGTSMGGIVAMKAAALAPSRVYSLTLIEPPAFGAALDVPAVAEIAHAMKRHWAEADRLDLRAFAKGFLDAIELDFPLPAQLPIGLEAAIRNLTTERPWKVDVPTGAIAAATFPKLVIAGGWSTAFDSIAERLAGLFGVELKVLTGATHAVQKLGPPFNELLASFLEEAEQNNPLLSTSKR